MSIIDLSNHNGRLTPTDIQDLKNRGVTKAIVGLQYPSDPFPPGVAHQQIPALTAAGIAVEVYAESQHIRDTWANVSAWGQYIQRIWIACEEPHVDRQWIDEHIDFIVGIGKTPGIYTANWWWTDKEFEHWFGDRELWVAQYDNNPNLDNYTKVGDWDYCTMKQYSENTYIGRLNVDVNSERLVVPQVGLATYETVGRVVNEDRATIINRIKGDLDKLA